jgi:hypothetical protein
MLNNLQSSLAQFLNNNQSIVNERVSIKEEEVVRKSLPKLRSLSNITHMNESTANEPLMRVEWLDDAMQAERKKIIDEDERGVPSHSQSRTDSTSHTHGQKRSRPESAMHQSFNAKKSRL